MEHYSQGDSIDGKRVLIRFKKLVPQLLKMSPTGFSGIKYKCSRDGYGEITLAHDDKTVETITSLKQDTHTGKGDALKCNGAFFIAETKRRLKCFDVTMMSGRHECSEGKPDVRVYMEIETPFESIANAIKAQEQKMLEHERQKLINHKS